MNLRYLGLDLKRVLRDPSNMFFCAGLPLILYLVFSGLNPESSGMLDSGRGNLSMYLMISMAAYGAATATSTVGGLAGVEKLQGWGRQLGLTPMTDAQFVALKTVLGMIIAALPISLIFLTGFLTNAEATPQTWLISAAITWAGSMLFALYGLLAALAFKSESAVGAAGGVLVVLGFLGNMFMPLGGTMLQIARFTPMYGYGQLARYFLMDGVFFDGTSGTVFTEPLWIPLTNLVAWIVIFALAAVTIVRRSRGRQ